MPYDITLEADTILLTGASLMLFPVIVGLMLLKLSWISSLVVRRSLSSLPVDLFVYDLFVFVIFLPGKSLF